MLACFGGKQFTLEWHHLINGLTDVPTDFPKVDQLAESGNLKAKPSTIQLIQLLRRKVLRKRKCFRKRPLEEAAVVQVCKVRGASHSAIQSVPPLGPDTDNSLIAF